MRFVIDMWMDGYETDEEMREACIQYIEDQLDSTATSVTIVEIKETPSI